MFIVSQWEVVFPTTVGMNRIEGGAKLLRECVPHDRGDEPKHTRLRLLR